MGMSEHEIRKLDAKPTMDKQETIYCCICMGPIAPEADGTWMHGRNAAPLDIGHGRCCADCDVEIVIPTRIRRLQHYARLPNWMKDRKDNPNA